MEENEKYNLSPDQYEEAVLRVAKVHNVIISDLDATGQTYKAEGKVIDLNSFYDDLENELWDLEQRSNSNTATEKFGDLKENYQAEVNGHIKRFGRIGGSLIDELDQHGFFAKENEDGSYTVEDKVIKNSAEEDLIEGPELLGSVNSTEISGEELKEMVNQSIKEEIDATQAYESRIKKFEEAGNTKAAELFKSIRDEEIVHQGEFRALLAELDSSYSENHQKGVEEGNDIIDNVNEPATEAAEGTLVVYHSSEAKLPFQFDFSKSREIGLHCGTEKAAKDWSKNYPDRSLYRLELEKVVPLELKDPDSVASIWANLKTLEGSGLFSKSEMAQFEKEIKGDDLIANSRLIRKAFLSKGYSLISYVNSLEDVGSTSYIILDPKIINKIEYVGNIGELNKEEKSDMKNSTEEIDNKYVKFMTGTLYETMADGDDEYAGPVSKGIFTKLADAVLANDLEIIKNILIQTWAKWERDDLDDEEKIFDPLGDRIANEGNEIWDGFDGAEMALNPEEDYTYHTKLPFKTAADLVVYDEALKLLGKLNFKDSRYLDWSKEYLLKCTTDCEDLVDYIGKEILIDDFESAEEAFEEDMYGFEAMTKEGIEKLTTTLSEALEKEGSVGVIQKILDSDDFSQDYRDQLVFIKNTSDLSDSTKVLNEILSTSETLLDDYEIDNLCQLIGEGGDYSDTFEDGDNDFGEYEEPEDWSKVDDYSEEDNTDSLDEEEPVDDTLEDSDLEDK